MTSGGDLPNNSQTPGLLLGANVLFNNPWTFLAPGNTGDRPTPGVAVNGRLRFNTDTLIYEYYDTLSAMWVELSGSGSGTVNPGTANAIAFYAANGTAVSPVSALANAVLISNGSSIPSMSTTLPTGLTIPGATITSSTAALTSGQVVAAPVNPTDLTNKAYVDAAIGGDVTAIIGTTNQVLANGTAGSPQTGNVTLSTPQDIAMGSTPTFAGLTLSSIPLGSSSGGTGVNNGTHTLTLGGNTAFSGAFTFTGTLTGNTGVTFPTSGTLATTSQLPTLPLSLANGGTNANLTASNGGIFYSTASAGAILSGTATANQILLSGSSAAPAWSTATYPASTTINQLLYSSSANTITGLSTANSAVLVTSSGGVPSLSTTLPNGLAMGTPASLTLTNAGGLVASTGTTATGTPSSTTFLRGDNTWSTPSLTGAGGLKSFQIFTSGTAATYTKPGGVSSILVEVLGGGGGGGGTSGASSSLSCGAGGGGGGYARLYVSSASSTYTYTIGGGGAGGVAGNNAGTSGGTTTFSASSLQATGGAGGIGGAANTAGIQGVGTVGGVGSNGNFNCNGQPGTGGNTFGAVVNSGVPGFGGSSLYGGGGVPPSSNNNAGNPGQVYGGGGSGAFSNTVNQAGGSGAGGLIIVWEFG
jgi:hypothetical protein